MQGAADAQANERTLSRVGQLTRVLHDSLRELGLDRRVLLAAEVVPEARDGLQYVASVFEQRADCTLNAIDSARLLQDELEKLAAALCARWVQWYAVPGGGDKVPRLLNDTRAFLSKVSDTACSTNTQLLTVLMAQDFQDLGGQVIRRVLDIILVIERELLAVLLENVAPETLARIAASGDVQPSPSIGGEPSQQRERPALEKLNESEVDDLLASLGF